MDETLGKIHFWITFLGAYAIFFPMHYLGVVGSAAPLSTSWAKAPSCRIGRELEYLHYRHRALRRRGAGPLLLQRLPEPEGWRPAGGNPWRAASLEWQTPETPPGHGNLGKELPIVYRWAYAYSVPGAPEIFSLKMCRR